MKYILSTMLLLLSLYVFPQGSTGERCTKELLRQLPGTWKAGPQGSIHNISATNLTKEKLITAAIHKMVSTNYKPTGCQISYSTAFGKDPGTGQTFIADPYHYTMYILRYLCDPASSDKSKWYVDISTPTTVNITVNAIFSLNNLYAANMPADDFRGYLKLKQRPEKKDGYYFMGEEKVDYNDPIYEYRWLITYNDTLPFQDVSRKEYLLIQKKRLQKDIQDSPSEKDYLSRYLKTIDEHLKLPDEELAQPAICMWNEEERFEKFVEEGTKGSFIAVKPNLAYYRKKLPLSTPQLFSVVYKISKGDPVFEENMAYIKTAIDFAKLKGMLGK
jgi:hypothetical protein